MCQWTDTWALLGDGRMGRTRENAKKKKRDDFRDGGSLIRVGVAVVCVRARATGQVYRIIQLSPK